MAYKSTDLIFIITQRRGYIPQLRTSGPIPNPMRVPISTCLSMLTASIELHQFDPATKNIVQLTIANLMDDTKFNKSTRQTVKLEPKQLKETKVISTEVPVIKPLVEEEPKSGDGNDSGTNDGINNTEDSTDKQPDTNVDGEQNANGGDINPDDENPEKMVKMAATDAAPLTEGQTIKTQVVNSQNNGGKKHHNKIK